MNPQQPEIRRNEKVRPTRTAARRRADLQDLDGGHPHGTDKGNKGGGRSGGVPPEQQSPFQS